MFYFIIWFLASMGSAYFLFKRVGIFTKGLGVVIMLSVALIATIFHNLLSSWLEFEDPIFFIIALWAFGTGIFLLSVWLAKLLSDKFFSNKGREN
ncbi:MAG: hypothetical protein Q8N22_03500 [bacterium]|nr:hypothetical protein [bacterium]